MTYTSSAKRAIRMRPKPRVNAWNVETVGAIKKKFEPFPQTNGPVRINWHMFPLNLIFLKLRHRKRVYHTGLKVTASKIHRILIRNCFLSQLPFLPPEFERLSLDKKRTRFFHSLSIMNNIHNAKNIPASLANEPTDSDILIRLIKMRGYIEFVRDFNQLIWQII